MTWEIALPLIVIIGVMIGLHEVQKANLERLKSQMLREIDYESAKVSDHLSMILRQEYRLCKLADALGWRSDETGNTWIKK